MTTRAGTSYMENENGYRASQLMEQGGVAREVSSASEVLQLFMQDRQQREAELESERLRWEAERRLREEQMEAERQQRERELLRREEQTQRQMELLQELVLGVKMQGEAASRRADRDKDVRVPKLTEEDDIVAYLTMFERLMRAYEIREDRWAFKLDSNLVGKAQQAYAALSAEDATSYDTLRKAILLRYDITEESYRQRFRSCKRSAGESSRELVARLDDLAMKWFKSCETMEEVIDRVILEQFLGMMQEDVRVFVKERQPKTSKEAGKIADDYFQARKENLHGHGDKGVNRGKSGDKSGEKSKIKCSRCGKLGHCERDCRVRLTTCDSEKKERYDGKTKVIRRDFKDVECFNCHNKGHYSSHCPRNAMFCTESKVNHQEQLVVTRHHIRPQVSVVKSGVVEGKQVENILLDTGCSRTLVHQDLVPRDKIREGEAVAIRCAHGDTVLYPLPHISLEIEGKPVSVEAAVSETLPMSVLLGTDTPELAKLLMEDQSKKIEDVFAVTTRAEAKRQGQEKQQKRREEEIFGEHPRLLDVEVHTSPMDGLENLDDELFGVSKAKLKKSKKEKRAEKQKRKELEIVEEQTDDEEGKEKDDSIVRHKLDISSEELKVFQATDPSLRSARIAVKTQESMEGTGFFSRDGLLYRRWLPPGRNGKELMVEQLVLPRRCRETVMRIAHCIPLAGHLGKDKTARRILQRFYWPTIYRDVAKFCRSCGSCQKAAGRKIMKAPLIPLPIITEPFTRIAMDVVGPLPRSSSGNRYVLVMQQDTQRQWP